MSDTLVDPTLSPDYIVRRYVWDLLRTNMPETWDAAEYGGLIPIVPLSEEPELEDFSGPHIVYGYQMDTVGNYYPVRSGSITFAVYDDNFRRLTKTLNVIQAAFERQDDAARDVNNYSTAYAVDSNKVFLGIRFGCFEIGYVEGGTPEYQEGGRQSGLINIRFDFLTTYNVTTAILPPA